MKKFIAIITFIFAAFSLHAQDYVFKVLASKGSNQIKSSSSWTDLSSGTKITDGQAIKVVSGGYVGLISSTGKVLELKKAGEYSTTDLSKQLSGGNNNFVGKYSDFVVNQMAGEGDSEYNYEVTGSVDRGAGDEVQLLAPKDIVMMKSVPVDISWIGQSNEGYEIVIQTFFNDVLFKKDVEGDEVTLNLTDNNSIKPGEKYIVRVIAKSNGEESNLHTIQLLEPGKEQSILDEYSKIEKELDDNSALGNLVLASFYEDKELPVYSLEKFEKAIELEPEVKDFEVSYKNYLASKGVYVAK